MLAYNLAVILWGAYVRAIGSGAGCGAHWPLCNGEVIPRAPTVETLIEYSHRLTSGLALLAVVALLIWTWRACAAGHPARRGAVLSMVFILTEAAVGAGLVLFELVADNATMARAMFMAAHLVNTFLLVAALTLTAWWLSGGGPTDIRARRGIALVWAALAIGAPAGRHQRRRGGARRHLVSGGLACRGLRGDALAHFSHPAAASRAPPAHRRDGRRAG